MSATSFSDISTFPEPNDTLAQATNTGLSSLNPGTYTASGFVGDNDNLDLLSDADLFKFELDAGDVVTIDPDTNIFYFDVLADSFLRLFDANGNQVMFNDDGAAPGEPPFGGTESYLSHVATTSGTYYAGVSGFNNSDYDPNVEGSGIGLAYGNYDIEITISGVGNTGAANSSSESNDTLAQATPTGLTTNIPDTFTTTATIGDNNNIAPTADVDLYQLQVGPAASIITYAINPLSPGLELYVRGFDSVGNEIPPINVVSSSDGSDIFSFDTNSLESFYIGISSFPNTNYDPNLEGSGNGNSSGDYELEISTEPSPSGLSRGSLVPGSSSPLNLMTSEFNPLLSTTSVMNPEVLV